VTEWFEWDDALGAAEQVFVDELRQRAAAWTGIPPSDGWVNAPDDGGPLMVAYDICGPGGILLTIGVFFDGRTLRGDELHNQLFTLPDRPTDLALTATGEPGELAAVAAEWFEAVLRRPIVRHDWTYDGRVYAQLYLFADTGDELGAMYNRELCPPGQLEKLAATRHVNPGGWVDVRGLGRPDAVVHVRGDAP
jgi:hypothetical protein